jgi:cytochrome bd-type quinol oxidase subunit 2
MKRLIKMVDRVVPQQYRPFFTFRWMTVFVAVVCLGATCVRVFVKLPADVLGRYQTMDRVLRSPLMILIIICAVAAGFATIYVTRGKSEYHRLRVIVFGLLLACLLSEMMILVFPY